MITQVITQVVGQQQPSAITMIVKCDLPGCEHTATFDQTTKAQVMVEQPWLNSYRTINTPDGRQIGYCSDVCEVKGVETGKHNQPEVPKLIPQGNAAAIAAAAQAAANARATDQAIRDGQPAKVQLTD